MNIKNTILTLALGAGSALVFAACDAPGDFDREPEETYGYDRKVDDEVELDDDDAILSPSTQDRYGTDDMNDMNEGDPRDDGLADPQDDGMIDGHQELDIGQGNQR